MSIYLEYMARIVVNNHKHKNRIYCNFSGFADPGAEKLDTIWPSLPQDNIMTKYFLSIVNQDLVQRASHVRDFLDEVQCFFPASLNVKAHRALIHYHARGLPPTTYVRI